MEYVQVKKYGPNSFGIPELWPTKIKKITSDVLPTMEPEFDYIISKAEYDAFILANKPNFDAGKAAIATEAANASRAQKFKQIREKWQSMADNFAADNVVGGIANAQAVALADAFATVEKYLRLNVPMKAIAEIDNITPIEPFLPQSRIDSMKAELLAFIQAIFSA